MPSDILGSEILEQTDDGKRSFRFVPGPVFTSLLLADEINRASPRTQSALLQAMAEHHVTVAGHRHDLPEPFHVLATQNPIEQQGTYPLPEAQLDRFLLKVDVDYPDEETERRILVETTSGSDTELQKILSAEKLIEIQGLVRRLPVGTQIVDRILNKFCFLKKSTKLAPIIDMPISEIKEIAKIYKIIKNSLKLISNPKKIIPIKK